MKNTINLLITDLDDTIWDWLRMWYNSFDPYLRNIRKISKTNLKDLKLDFKELHKRYKTSEVSYAYKELKSLSSEEVSKIEKESTKISIIHQYYRDKKNNLVLYDGVLKTLIRLKKKGVKIVGFTESNSFYTMYRIKTLDLDGVFDFIYTPDDHGIPPSVKRYYAEDFWSPKITKFKVLPKNSPKPNPDILLKIIKEVGGKKSNTIYIGDKLDRDVHMANQANIISIYAKYGSKLDTKKYKLLRQVTHWSDKDVQREIQFKKIMLNKSIKANYSIDRFDEILNLFNFISFNKK